MAKKTEKIRRLVEKLLEDTGQTAPPIDVKRIVIHLGAKLKYGPLGDISGIIYQEENQIIIGVNNYNDSNAYENRQRFTIAHELGHLKLHEHNSLYVDKMFPVNIRLRDKSSSEAVDADEIEANAFAAELLMPKFMLVEENELQKEALDFEEVDSVIDILANKYEVSSQAMTFRLINLGIIAN